jgi:hypothetical protein
MEVGRRVQVRDSPRNFEFQGASLRYESSFDVESSLTRCKATARCADG